MTASTPPGDTRLSQIALAALSVWLRHRMLAAGIGLVLFAAMVGPRLIGRRSYTAEASFVPQERQQAGGALSTLAAQFGVALPTSSTSESPAFYAALVTTRTILSQVVTTRYPVKIKDVDGGTLVELWDVPGRSDAARLEEAIKLLRESMKVDIARETGAVSVTVTSGSPELAAQVLQRILDLVNDFNVNRRQSQAAAERRFVEQRLQQVGKELADAEGELSRFLQANRQLPPRLQFENDRLQRAVTLQQQLYTSLAQSYEQARINEARNVAVITLIDQPVVPVSPNRRHLVVRTLEAIIATVILSMVIALLLDFFRGAHGRGDTDVLELEALWRDTVTDLRHPWRAVLRSVRAMRTPATGS